MVGHPRLDAFAQGYSFPLDDYQLRAARALDDGNAVLVAAPTGAGKTVVGEFAVALALGSGTKCFYTTPIKALSNQKYNDLVGRYGPGAVGLLTGDQSINGDAPVVVMTTEVLRNMLYSGSRALAGLEYVVMDEVHYLADRFRGAVWEEVIIHLDRSVKLVALSATVSNAEEFGDWLRTVRGATEVVVSEHRPVPLWQHVLVDQTLYDLFAEDEVNPALLRIARSAHGHDVIARSRGRGGRVYGQGRIRWATRPQIVEALDRQGLLPAIVFIFSQAGCEDAVRQCRRAGLWLTTDAERAEIRRITDERTRDLGEADRAVIGFAELCDGLERGVAAHHAGLVPSLKSVIEELFAGGLLKAVFATETLALGINMPARTVVLERLTKWNGDAHVQLTAGEYTQLTGRAGRRGIDIEGHAVVLAMPGFDPELIAGLASTRTYPLRSSFRPGYNMTVNLVSQLGREQARALLQTSFAQFQADRSVVGLDRQVAALAEQQAEYAAKMTCDRGDFASYATLRRQLSETESGRSSARSASRRAGALESLQGLRKGDVITVPAGRRPGLAVVVNPGLDDPADPHPMVLTLDRQLKRLSLKDFPAPVTVQTRVSIPRNFNGRSPNARRDLASTLRNTGEQPRKPDATADDSLRDYDRRIDQLRAELKAHPCHRCPDREEHARWGEKYTRLAARITELEEKIAGRATTVAVTFDHVCAVLDELGYLDGDQATDAGRILARIYAESDLLIAETLRRGDLVGLSAPDLVAALSTVVYESRTPTDATPKLPRGEVRERVEAMAARQQLLAGLEEQEKLHTLRKLDEGFALPAWRWAVGHGLDEILTDAGMPAGEFVRWCKQIIDLVGQVGNADPRLRSTAREATDLLRRGIVALE